MTSEQKILCGLALAIIVFNIQTAVCILPPMNDDPQRYFDALTNGFPDDYLDSHFFHRYIKFGLFHLMVMSPVLAKILNVLLLVPTALLFYKLIRDYLSLPPIVCASSVALGNLVPGQVMIPASIESSYSVYGLTLVLTGWLVGRKYLMEERVTRKYLYLSLTLIICYFAAESLGQAVFLVPPLLVLVLAVETTQIRRLALITVYCVAVFPRFFQMLLKPVGNEEIHFFAFELIISRLKELVEYTTFIPFLNLRLWDANWLFVLGAILALMIVCLIVEKFRKNDTRSTHGDVNILISPRLINYSVAFGSVWAISSIFPILFFDQVFRPRYGYMTGYGLGILISLSTLYLMNRHHALKQKAAHSLIVICAVSGLLRWEYTLEHAKKYNLSYKSIEALSIRENWPENSQIAIFGDLYPRAQYFRRSSGLLSYITKRDDLRAILPLEYERHDPFTSSSNKSTDMVGLEPSKPLFIYRETSRSGQEFDRLEYALIFTKTSELNKDWEIIQLDVTTGEKTSFGTGTGDDQLTLALSELASAGVTVCEIAWAGCQ